MDYGGQWVVLTLLFIFFLFSGFYCSLAHSSISSLSEAKIKKLSDDGVKGARRIQRILADSERFSATMDFSFLCCVILSALSAYIAFGSLLIAVFSDLFRAAGSAAFILARVVAVCLLSCIVLFLTLIISRFLPQHLGAGNPERFAFFCAPGVVFILAVLKPGVFLAGKISAVLAKLLGSDPADLPPDVTEEEIRQMVDEGTEIGVIESSQMEMINNVFEFDDTTASDVMTHRTNMIAVPRGTKISEIVSLAIDEGFSRIPVYEEDIDDVIGAVYVKDLLTLINHDPGDDAIIDPYIRPVLYVPESAKLPELFGLLSSKRAHLAIVVDEYGGTSGLLTMEDLVEEIVGNIQDEYDSEEGAVIQIDDTSYSLDGGVELEELEKLFDISFERTDDYDTVGGLIIHQLGRIPSASEDICITVNNVQFTVLLVEDRRIARVKAVRICAPDDPSETEQPKT